MLIVLGGLPGVGKTTIARELARALGAVHVRIDSIEQAIRDSGATAEPLNDAGYRAAYAVALDNLLLGRTVIADSVNPLLITREAWRKIAQRAQVKFLEVEVQCSDVVEHKNRVETRTRDIPGLRAPTWREVVTREYGPWDRDHLVVDTAAGSIEQSVEMIRKTFGER